MNYVNYYSICVQNINLRRILEEQRYSKTHLHTWRCVPGNFLVGFTWRTRFLHVLHVEKVSVNELKISRHVWVKHLLYPFVVSMASPDISYHDPTPWLLEWGYTSITARVQLAVCCQWQCPSHKKNNKDSNKNSVEDRQDVGSNL